MYLRKLYGISIRTLISLIIWFSSAGNKEAVFIGENKPTIAHATSKALKDATRLVTSFREVRHGFKENVEVLEFSETLFIIFPSVHMIFIYYIILSSTCNEC